MISKLEAILGQQRPEVETTVLVYGLNHRSSSIELREQFVISQGEERELLQRILTNSPKRTAIKEALCLSTCNRTEIVAVVQAGEEPIAEASAHLERVFAERFGKEIESFKDAIYSLSGEQAVSHLFHVASGLDSLIPGEPQILGQLKDAYHVARGIGTTGKVLNRLLHRAFRAAKSVRSRTEVGRYAVSVGYAARKLSEQIFGDLSRATVLLIGAGNTGMLTLRHLLGAGVGRVLIASRNHAKAVEVAAGVSGLPIQLNAVGRYLKEIDIVIGASSIPKPGEFLVTAEEVRGSLAGRPGGVQFFIDLGVPRNFDPEIANLSDAFLYDIDDLEGIVRQNLDVRLVESTRATSMLSGEVEEFMGWLGTSALEGSIRELRGDIALFNEQELAKSLKRLSILKLPEKERQLLERELKRLSEAVVAKVLHQPLTVVKTRGRSDPSWAAIFRELFVRSDRAQLDEVERLSQAEEESRPTRRSVVQGKRG